LIWVSSLVIAVGTAARQIHAERENRTLFPLLAKPVTRAEVVLGKFFGCWMASGIALLLFYLFFAVISGMKEGDWPLLEYAQAFWLHWLTLAVVICMALLGSVIFSAPSANATICFSIIAGIFVLGAHLNKIAASEPKFLGLLVSLLYFAIPHIDLFYIVRERLVFEQNLVNWGAVLLATGYCAAYAGMLLCGTWLIFRRKILTGA